jgi:hypothetical protein
MATDTTAHQERHGAVTRSFTLPLQSIGLAVTSSALILVHLAALATVGVFVVAPEQHDGWSRIIAPAIGFAVALAIALGIGWNRRCYWDDPEQVDQWNFGRFCQRFTTLEARESSLRETHPASTDGGDARIAVNEQHRMSRAEAKAHLEMIKKELDVEQQRKEGNGPTDRWINGSGYVDLWRHLYSFEEALILREDPGAVISEGRWDQLRLKRSDIENKDELLKRLDDALSILEEQRQHAAGVASFEHSFGVTNPKQRQTASSAREATATSVQSRENEDLPDLPGDPPEPPTNGAGPNLQSEPEAASQNGGVPELEKTALHACSTIRDTRIIINDFRIQKLEGLLETRNRLILIGSVTAVAAYLLLVFAILAGASQSHVIAGFTFFAVGAVVSLFDELRMGMGSRQPFEADFNIESVRIWHTPVLAGVAGVAGVVLTVLLYNTTAEQMYLSAEGGVDSLSVGVASLSDVFTQDRSIHLVIAAIFGLVPGLLVDRLRQSAEKYKIGLESTSPHEQR